MNSLVGNTFVQLSALINQELTAAHVPQATLLLPELRFHFWIQKKNGVIIIVLSWVSIHLAHRASFASEPPYSTSVTKVDAQQPIRTSLAPTRVSPPPERKVWVIYTAAVSVVLHANAHFSCTDIRKVTEG